MRYLLVNSIVVFFFCFCSFGYVANGQNKDTPVNQEFQPAEEPLPESNRQSGQFYPSFSPYQNQPLGHSRPFYYPSNQQQEGAYSQRYQPNYQQQLAYDTPRYSNYKDTYRESDTTENAEILGSGNFGVIKGGTFYSNNDGESSKYDDEYNSYFHNGHGRPSYHRGPANPRPYQHEQFANFRDFADINTPNDRQYSQYVVVYVNKNATKESGEAQIPKHALNKPKNIFESLQLLDDEKNEEKVPEKKLSLSKRKLLKHNSDTNKKYETKKYKYKKSIKSEDKVNRDYELLALS